VARCQRGATTYRHNCGTFTWSPGVQGLVQLLLEVKIAALDCRQGSISGERGSLAASLDYSIAKNGQWLADMFGVYSDGTLRARRVLRRTNPERKRPGPVEIFLNPAILSPREVTIRLDARALESKAEFERVREALSARLIRPKPTNADEPEHGPSIPTGNWFQSLDGRALLQGAFEEEIIFGLRNIPIYDKATSSQVLRRTFENPSYNAFGNPGVLLNDFIEPQLPDRILLGLASPTEHADLLRRAENISVAMSASDFPSIALMSALNARHNLKIDLDYSYPAGGELIDSVLESAGEPPLLCVVALAATHECWAGKFARLYRPVMLMPESSKKVITGPGSQKSKTGSHSYFLRNPSTASYYFDDLRRNGLTGKTWEANSHLYFNEAMRLLRSGGTDARAVLWFPFYNFNIWFTGCSEVPIPHLKHRHPLNSVLFIRRDLPLGKKLGSSLAALIRHTWLNLLESREFVRQVALGIAEKNDYLRILARLSGLNFELAEAS
jgi:hypothetical protein